MALRRAKPERQSQRCTLRVGWHERLAARLQDYICLRGLACMQGRCEACFAPELGQNGRWPASCCGTRGLFGEGLTLVTLTHSASSLLVQHVDCGGADRARLLCSSRDTQVLSHSVSV